MEKKPIKVSKCKYDRLCRERFKGYVGVPNDELEEFDAQYKIIGFYAWKLNITHAGRNLC